MPPAAFARWRSVARRRRAPLAGGIVVVLAILVVALLGGGNRPGRLAGWLPANATAYAELRIDPPGDQGMNLGAFLARFPGLEDRASLEASFGSAVRGLVGALTNGAVDDAALRAWLGNTVAVTAIDGEGAVLIQVGDRAAASRWMTDQAAARGITLATDPPGALFVQGGGSTLGLEGDLLVVGSREAVRSVLRTGGRGEFARGAGFRAAVATVRDPAIVYAYADLGESRSNGRSDASTPSGWASLAVRIESDRIVGTASLSPDGAGAGSLPVRPTPAASPAADGAAVRPIAEGLPAETLLAVELPGLGSGIGDLLGRAFAVLGSGSTGSEGPLGALGALGAGGSLFDWAGDGAVVALPAGVPTDRATGRSDGSELALVLAARDPEAASSFFSALRLLVRFGGGALGVGAITEEAHGSGSIVAIHLGPLVRQVFLPDRTTAASDPVTMLLRSTLRDVVARQDGIVALSVSNGRLIVSGDPSTVGALIDVTSGSALSASTGYRSAFAGAEPASNGRIYGDLPGLMDLVVGRLPKPLRRWIGSAGATVGDRLGPVGGTLSAGDPMQVRFVITAR